MSNLLPIISRSQEFILLTEKLWDYIKSITNIKLIFILFLGQQDVLST